MNVNINTDSINGIKPNYDFINNFDSNPVMIRILVVIIVAYYTIIYFSVKNEIVPTATKSSSSIGIIGFLLWLLFIIILLLNGVRYFYDLNITTGIKGIFKREPEIDINVTTVSGKPLVNPVPEIMYEKQVFHVSDNKYDFNNAKAICAAYGSKLASYDQIEQSYNDGAEWCGYGWSDGQMALYPTQKKTYNKLLSRNSDYEYKSYFIFTLKWQISGTKNRVQETNKKVIATTERGFSLEGLSSYLNFNYLEFYK